MSSPPTWNTADFKCREPTWTVREVARHRPTGAPVMYQRWHDLLFLHWRWDAAAIQRTLPEGLTVDTRDGEAWLGVVPFGMSGVRPRGLPAVGWLSRFWELNLRTYVRSADGTPGVWFYSLDCNRRMAVAIARRFFRLPYVFARISADGRLGTASGVTHYESRRPGGGGVNRFAYAAAGVAEVAEPRSLAWWLVERYVLFAGGSKGRALHLGRVWHEPYRVAPARVGLVQTSLFADNGFTPPGRDPDHALVAEGVDVAVYPLRRWVGGPDGA